MVYTIFRGIVLTVLVWAGVLAWHLLKDPEQFPVRHIKVTSNYQHVSPQVLENLIMPFASQGFCGAHLSDLQQQLAQLPWVANVEVERIWPDTFSIRVVEHHPMARWNEGKLLSDQMQVFVVPEATVPNHLPQLNAADDQAPLMAQYYQKITALLQPYHLEVTKFEMNSRQAFHMVLNSNIDIYFGRNDPIADFQKFMTVYKKIIGQRIGQVSSIDFRYNNGLAIAWKKPDELDDLTY